MNPRAKSKQAEFPLKKEESPEESMRRLHSMEALGKQIMDLEHRRAAKQKVVDEALADVKNGRKAVSGIDIEREQLVTELNAIATGMFSERLNFPPAPAPEPSDTAAMRNRLMEVAVQLGKLPAEGTDEFKKLTATEQKLIPKKRKEVSDEGEKMIKEMRRAIKAKDLETVTFVAGAKKDRPLLEIKLFQYSDNTWADVWLLNLVEVDIHVQGADLTHFDLNSFLDTIDADAAGMDPWSKPEVCPTQEAATAHAIANIRDALRALEPKPSGVVLQEMQIVESRLRQVEAQLPTSYRSDKPLRILSEDQDEPGFEGASSPKTGLPPQDFQEGDDDVDSGAGGPVETFKKKKQRRKAKASARESTVPACRPERSARDADR